MVNIFKDLIIDGAVSGAILTLIATVISLILYKLKRVENHCIQFCAAAMLQAIKPIMVKSATIVGFFGHITIGMVFGIIIALVLQLSGSQYSYMKGMGVGLTFWVFLHQVTIGRFWVKPNYNVSPKGALWVLGIHVLQGALVVLFLAI